MDNTAEAARQPESSTKFVTVVALRFGRLKSPKGAPIRVPDSAPAVNLSGEDPPALAGRTTPHWTRRAPAARRVLFPQTVCAV